MGYHWVTFADRKSGFIETAKGEDVRAIAETFGTVKAIDIMPYPADPILRRPEGDKNPCPPFCYTPLQCKGRGSCPKSYACSE